MSHYNKVQEYKQATFTALEYTRYSLGIQKDEPRRLIVSHDCHIEPKRNKYCQMIEISLYKLSDVTNKLSDRGFVIKAIGDSGINGLKLVCVGWDHLIPLAMN